MGAFRTRPEIGLKSANDKDNQQNHDNCSQQTVT